MFQSTKKPALNPRSPSDDELIRLAQGGKLDAFNQLYERYLPVVYKRVRYVIPQSDVEDVTQEIFITMLKSLKSFKGAAQFSTWLRTLTNRRVADYYRRRNPADSNQALDFGELELNEIPDSGENSGGVLDERIMVRRALAAMPEQYREVLLLRFAEDLQFNEIAQIQGRSLEATKSLFRRAIADLRHTLEESNASRPHP
jgi:RNA polymerase sigma-70 factor (ECF subfamily)